VDDSLAHATFIGEGDRVAVCRIAIHTLLNNSVTDSRVAERMLDVERVRYVTAPLRTRWR